MISALLMPSLGEACFETISMSFLNFFILAHYFLFLFSIYALIFPYISIIIIYILRNYYFPKEFKGFNQSMNRSGYRYRYHRSYYDSTINTSANTTFSTTQKHVTTWLSLYVAPWSRKKDILVHRITIYKAFNELINTIAQFIYYLLYFLIRPDTIYLYYRNLWFPIKQSKWMNWKSMNKPRKMHGMMTDDVPYIPRYSSYHQYHKSKKTKFSIENLHNASQQQDQLDIPSNIRCMSKSNDWIAAWNNIKITDRTHDNYMSNLILKALLSNGKSSLDINLDNNNHDSLHTVVNQNRNYENMLTDNNWYGTIRSERYFKDDYGIDKILCGDDDDNNVNRKYKYFANINVNGENKVVDNYRDSDDDDDDYNDVIAQLSPLHQHYHNSKQHSNNINSNNTTFSRKFRDDYFKCTNIHDILVTVLNNYRNQFLDDQIGNIAEYDKIKLKQINSIEELSKYNGMINIQDLSLMLDDILDYYYPNNKCLNVKEKFMIISDFNLWLEENHILFIKSTSPYYDHHNNNNKNTNRRLLVNNFNGNKSYNTQSTIRQKLYQRYSRSVKKSYINTINDENNHNNNKNNCNNNENDNDNSSDFSSTIFDGYDLHVAISCDKFFAWFHHIDLKR